MIIIIDEEFLYLMWKLSKISYLSKNAAFLSLFFVLDCDNACLVGSIRWSAAEVKYYGGHIWVAKKIPNHFFTIYCTGLWTGRRRNSRFLWIPCPTDIHPVGEHHDVPGSGQLFVPCSAVLLQRKESGQPFRYRFTRYEELLCIKCFIPENRVNFSVVFYFIFFLDIFRLRWTGHTWTTKQRYQKKSIL